MFFASDNWAGAHPRINERLTKEAGGFASAYGTSELDKAIEARFNDIFEKEVAVFFVATGTAANSLSLASLAKPGGITFAHSEAHVIEDECGAPDFFSGMRISPVDGTLGKIDPAQLEAKNCPLSSDCRSSWPGQRHHTHAGDGSWNDLQPGGNQLHLHHCEGSRSSVAYGWRTLCQCAGGP